ncbi:Ig-like domain-containing protein [Marinobacter caseinilyticus]|uniref:Ig-like domain-containing protein n=1 Tax=Marinobacter caseinilyticus TaxID=2692195 RepID=UPI00140A32C3|nr:Ig-like domain-containing protein [Marinobacter caseinilyticus]
MIRFSKRSFLWVFLSAALAACGGGGGSDGTDSVTSGGGGSGSGGSTDLTPPSVVSTSPANSQDGVALGSALSVTFNESVDLTSVRATFQLSESGGSPVFGDVILQNSGRTAVFTPDSPLLEYTGYQANIQAFDRALNPMPSAYVWSFQTQDLTAPTTTPSRTSGLFNTELDVTLSCDDGAGSGCANTYYSTDGSEPSIPYSGSIRIGGGVTVLRFYSVDNAGRAEPEVQEVYTVDLTPPEVVQPTVPLADATDVPRNTDVVVTFSEAIDPATINEGSFYLDNGMPGTVSYDEMSYTATLDPLVRLECGTVYQATLDIGIADRAGNTLAAPEQFSFAVTSDCVAPQTTGAQAPGYYPGTSLDVMLSCTDATSGCARLVYTTDGSNPALSPVNGTLVEGPSSGAISLPKGVTRLRYYAEDLAGNAEPVKESLYMVSDEGLLYVGAEDGLMVGTGPEADDFQRLDPSASEHLSHDSASGRLWGDSNDVVLYSDDDGLSWHRVNVDSRFSSNLLLNDIDSQGSRVALASSEGVVFTDDTFGDYYYSDSGNGLASSSVTAVAFAGKDLFAIASTDLFVSRNYGVSFGALGVAEGLPDSTLLDVRQCEGLVFVSSYAGLSVSADNGESFTLYNSGDGLAADDVYDACSVNGIWYVLTGAGVSTSADQGQSFSNAPITMQFPLQLAVAGTDVFVTAKESVGTDVRLFVSNDGGISFGAAVTAADGLRADLVTSITSGGGQVMISGGGGLSVTGDGGASFSLPGLSADIVRDIAASGGRLFVSGYSGLSVSDDDGVTFETRSIAQGLGSTRLNDLAFVGSTLYVATDNGLAESIDNGNGFTRYTVADGLADNTVNDLENLNGTLFIATDGGLSLPATKGGVAYQSLYASDGLATDRIETLASYGSTLYAGSDSGGDGISVTSDGGANWVVRNSANSGLGVSAIWDLYADANALYAAIATDLNVSTDEGVSFSINTALEGLSAFNVEYVGSFGNVLYVGTSDGLAISADAGASFVLRDVGATQDVSLFSTKATLYVP